MRALPTPHLSSAAWAKSGSSSKSQGLGLTKECQKNPEKYLYLRLGALGRASGPRHSLAGKLHWTWFGDTPQVFCLSENIRQWLCCGFTSFGSGWNRVFHWGHRFFISIHRRPNLGPTVGFFLRTVGYPWKFLWPPKVKNQKIQTKPERMWHWHKVIHFSRYKLLILDNNQGEESRNPW